MHRALFLFALLAFCQCGWGGDARPFLTKNQNPLLLVFGQPIASAAALPDLGEWHSDWSLNLSNTLINEISDNETLNIDGEIYHLNLQIEYGLSEQWSLGTQLGWLEHDGGFMDQPIEQYHSWLGLPQGDRLNVPRDRLLYRYQRNDNERLNLQETSSGMGDIQVFVAHKLTRAPQHDYSLRFSIKLPTGDPEQLTGSGATDFAIWLAGRETTGETWQLYGTAGLLLLGKGEVLTESQEDHVLFGCLGIQWQYSSTLAIKLQSEWNTAFYKGTDIRFMDDAVQLSFGTSWQISPRLQFDFAISEDIKVEASPDVTFHFAVRFRH